MILKHPLTVDFLANISPKGGSFSCGSIYLFCCSRYFQLQDCVNRIELKQSAACVATVMMNM